MKILIPTSIYQKLRGYAQATKFEISGLGKISVGTRNTITIEDIKIFEQEVSYASTTLDRKALAKFYDELMKKDEDTSVWRLWWHSHANMDTFWSATDVATINDFDTELDADNWMLSLETNRKGEIITRVDIFRPLRVTVPDIPWEIQFDNKKIEDKAFDETMEKVRVPTKKKKTKTIRPNGATSMSPSFTMKRNDKNQIEIVDKTRENEEGLLFPDEMN